MRCTPARHSDASIAHGIGTNKGFHGVEVPAFPRGEQFLGGLPVDVRSWSSPPQALTSDSVTIRPRRGGPGL
jgi:hypothetical protein